MMNIRTIISAVALLTVAISSSATAQTYTLGYDQTLYTTTVGSTVDVQLVLTEQIAGSEVARLAVGGNDGLFAFSADTDFSVFTGGATGSIFNGTVIINPAFAGVLLDSGQAVTTGPGNVSLEGNEGTSDSGDGEFGVNGVMVSPTEYQLVLATLQFDAGDVGSLTTLELGDHVNPLAPPFLFGDGTTPDIGFVNSQILVTAIPEPGSLAFITLIAGAGLLQRRRK